MKSALCKGFTMVELSIALVFVGILSVSLAVVMNSMLVSYRKGNTMAQVNTTGTDLVDDFRAATQRSSAQSLITVCNVLYADDALGRDKCLSDDAYDFISSTHFSKVKMGGREFDAPIYGAYCAGSYSYIWNSGYYFSNEAHFKEKDEGTWATLKIENGEIKYLDGTDDHPFKLLKVRDQNRSVCAAIYNSSVMGNENVNSEIDISNREMDEEPEQLLISRGANDLAIYDLTISRPVVNYDNNSVFYYGSFILGTADGGVDILSRNNACATPSGYDYVYNYCAINKFSFAVRASGE